MKYLLSILKKNNNMSKINSTFWYKNIFYFTKYQILILAFTFYSICNVNSQKNNNAIIDDFIKTINDKKCLVMNVKDIDVIKLKRATRKAMTKYYTNASLLDNNGMVTRESTQKFKEMFEEESKLLSDITQNTYNMNSDDYASMVFEFFTNTGVIFTLSNPMINKVYENEGYYFTEVEVIKTVHNYLNNKMVMEKCKKGRQLKLVITFRSTIYDIENSLIQNIKGSLIRECNDSNPAWGWNLEGGSISFTSEKSDQLNPFPTINPKMNNGFFAKLGAYYYKSIGTSEKLWLKMGLQSGIAQMASSIDSCSFNINNTTDAFGSTSIKYDKFNRTTNIETEFTEILSLFQVTLPLALKYDIYQTASKKMGLGVELGVSGTINFNIKKSWNGRISTKGTYIIGNNSYTIPTQNADIDNNAYGLKSNIYFDDASKLSSSNGTKASLPANFGIKLNPIIAANMSPYFYWAISDKSMLQIGIPISYAFTNFFKPSNTSKILFNGVPKIDGSIQDRIDQGLESSMAEDLFKSSKSLSIGIQFGIFTLIK